MQLWFFFFVCVCVCRFFLFICFLDVRTQQNWNYGWLCLLFSYGVMCWITLFIWLWWLSEDLYFGICLDSPRSVFGCAPYFCKWSKTIKHHGRIGQRRKIARQMMISFLLFFLTLTKCTCVFVIRNGAKVAHNKLLAVANGNVRTLCMRLPHNQT